MDDRIDIAVVGAAVLVGEQVLALLKARAFPAGRVHALDRDDVAVSTVDYGNRELPIGSAAGFDFATVQLVFFTGDAAMSAALARKAAAAGCRVIDGSPQFRLAADVALVVPEVNGEVLAGRGDGTIVASPASTVIASLLALKPLQDAAGLERIDVTTWEAASGAGRAAVEELGRQTAALLNFRDLETSAFPRQIAFNVLPAVGALDDDGSSASERALVDEIRKVLADDSLPINATATQVPVFYGDAVALHLETCRTLSASAVRERLAEAPGITVTDARDTAAWPTAVTEASGEDAVFVGRVREDRSRPNGINLWLVTDNLRKGAALNLVQIAEAWFRSSR